MAQLDTLEQARDATDDKTVAVDRSLSLPDWQLQGINRIIDIYKGRSEDLKRLLGPMLKALGGQRFAQEGSRFVIAREAATALVSAFNRDLLADKARRESIGLAAGLNLVQIPKRWERGMESAKRFVALAGLPMEFAGKAFIDQRNNIETLRGRPPQAKLADYQLEVLEGMLREVLQDAGRAIVELPTGAGKTRVAMEAIRAWLFHRGKVNDTVIWLAHSEELCEQAAEDARKVWEDSAESPHTDLVRLWGKFTKDIRVNEFQHVLRSPDPQILISTPQRLLSLLRDSSNREGRLTTNSIRNASLVIVDEAHRAAAPMYREIMSNIEECNSTCSIIGLTATPFRMEYLEPAEKGTEDLRDIFKKLIQPSKTLQRPFRKSLQKKKILAQAQFEYLSTQATIRLGAAPRGADKAMQEKADTHKRRSVVLPEIIKIAQDPEARILYFGPTVKDAQCMAFLLNSEGVRSGAISGETAPCTRISMIEDFKNGEIQVLTNCQVLTTGFNAPKVSHVVIARPTVSRVLFEQMIGRGLRGPKFGGTELCTIVVCQDEFAGQKPELGYEKYLEIWNENQ